MDDDLTFNTRKKGIEAGAAAVGIAAVGDLKRIDPTNDASKFLKNAKAIVIALVPDPPGIRNADQPFEYSSLSQPGYLKADGAALSMRNFLSREGYATHVIRREQMTDKTLAGTWIKTLSLKHAAKAAGLGSIGRHTLLITPDHGPRVRLSGFVTDAPLETGAPFTEELCSNCGACERTCPSGAISESGFSFANCAMYLFSGLSINQLKTPDLSAISENAGRLASCASGWLESLATGKRLYYTCGACVRNCAPRRGDRASGKP
ncbi:MAG TPA: 4Fe-4S binding protein [bacterium]|nr:4Fe-4S binding protein [bacterium]